MRAFDYSLRTCLVGIALLAVVPALCVILLTSNEYEEHTRQDCLDQARRLNNSLAALQTGLTQGARSLLTTLAALPALRQRDQAACDTLLTELLRDHPEFTNILLTDEAGVVVSSGLPPFKGVRLSDRKYFKDAMRTGGFSVGEYNIGRTTNEPILVFAMPVRSESGQVSGVVGVSFRLDHYYTFLKNYALPADAQVSFFDHAGRRMFTYPRNEAFPLGEPPRPDLLEVFAQSPTDENIFFDKRYTGEDGLYTFARLRAAVDGPVYMVILTTFSLDDALAPGRRLKARNLALMLLAGLAAVVVALAVGQRSVLRGLSTLVDVAGRLGRLDLTARADAASGGVEVRRLGQAFNHMAEALEAKNRQLQESALALRHARAMLVNILESMPSAVIGLNVDGLVTHWNDAAVRMSGTPREEALGRSLAECFAWLAPELERPGLPRRGDKPLVMEKLPFAQTTETRFLDILAYPLVSNGEEGAVIRVDDVTQRVRMEEMLLQNEKMSTVGGLAGGMAHEINNPLAGILQSLQIIVRRLSPDLPANVETAGRLGTDIATVREYLKIRGILDFLDSIRESGERAARIVRNMLGFIRKSASTKLGQNLAELLDRTVEIASTDYDLKRKYDFRRIEIVRDYATDVPAVPCSPTEIEQVVYNLVYNAAQAMAAGVGDAASPRIVLRVYRDGAFGVFEVQDNGPGMEESVIKRAFEPLFTTKPLGEGTGLGLALARFIVEKNHGGSLEAFSAPGQGARFVVRLPLVASASESEPLPPQGT